MSAEYSSLERHECVEMLNDKRDVDICSFLHLRSGETHAILMLWI